MEAGDLISGKYRLQRMLGAGNMGSVWAARNELTNRDFAVKFLRTDLSQHEEALNRFFLEARACGQIRHQSIVDVYDMGQAEDGSPYLVMELLEGEAFDQRLRRQGRLRPVDVCRWIATVSRGLEEAHTRGLIHRDLKPGNIFFAIDPRGDVVPKVLDFGISKEISDDLIRTSANGAVLGSPAYMSPEQASGAVAIDARTDVWSLGVIMYEALTGRLPFDARNYNALMVKIINEQHRPAIELTPEIPPQLSALLDAVLQKSPEQRIRSAGELAEKLELVYATLTSTALGAAPRELDPLLGATQNGWFNPRATGGRSPFSRALLIGGALGLVALIGVGTFLLKDLVGASSFTPVARIAAPVTQLVTRAQVQAKEAEAARKVQAAERRAQEAKSKAESAVNERAELHAKQGAAKSASGSGPAKPDEPDDDKPADDPHGGVDQAGF